MLTTHFQRVHGDACILHPTPVVWLLQSVRARRPATTRGGGGECISFVDDATDPELLVVGGGYVPTWLPVAEKRPRLNKSAERRPWL